MSTIIRPLKHINAEKKAIQNQLLKFRKRLIELMIEEFQVCEGSRRYEEKMEKIPVGNRRKEEMLVGRRYWKEWFRDEDTGKKIFVERSQIVRVNGEWQVPN